MAAFNSHFIRRIHHLTKYPSIDNYHQMDERSVEFGDDEMVYVHEKIDGMNVRVVLHFDDYRLVDFFIGSRQGIIYARGDRNFASDLDVIQQIHAVFPSLFADDIAPIHPLTGHNGLTVIYGELFGGTIGKAKREYSADESAVGFRVFDVATISLPDMDAPFDSQQIGDYRDKNLQFTFIDDLSLSDVSPSLECAPLLWTSRGDWMPDDPVETKAWLEKSVTGTSCNLGGGLGSPEGVVVRNFDRSKIAKIRFANYRKVG